MLFFIKEVIKIKKIKLELILDVHDNISINNIRVQSHDVIDGFEITREKLNDEDDVTCNFYLDKLTIKSIEELKGGD